MGRLSKKQQKIYQEVAVNQLYTLSNAISLLKKYASTKFRETVEIAVNLGIDPRKSDQIVRASTNLPKGTGKIVRVAVFAQGDNAIAAKNAGADLVGFEELAEQIKSGEINFDVVIATPDAMRLVGQLGQILGPRGLMPNPKVGTVTLNIEAAVKNVKSGQVRYRADKNGIIHCLIGKIDFSEEDLIQNISVLIADLKKHKPSSAKGTYIKKVSITTTMGPGLAIDIASLPV